MDFWFEEMTNQQIVTHAYHIRISIARYIYIRKYIYRLNGNLSWIFAKKNDGFFLSPPPRPRSFIPFNSSRSPMHSVWRTKYFNFLSGFMTNASKVFERIQFLFLFFIFNAFETPSNLLYVRKRIISFNFFQFKFFNY